MKVIVFGLGQYYINRKEKLLSLSQVDIVAYTDNNNLLWENVFDGVFIVSPKDAVKIYCDAFVIMSSYADEIYNQLLGMGIEKTKILYWDFFYAKVVSGTRYILQGAGDNSGKNNILIISTDLNYNGGSLAAIYAALAVEKKKNRVVLAVPSYDDRLASEVTQKGITIYVCPSLPYIFDQEKEWISQFDVVLINVFQMIQSVRILCNFRPILWWIHEPVEIIDEVRSKFWNCVPKEDFNNVAIYGVSGIAKKNFNKYYPERLQKILCYGIPDMGRGYLECDRKRTNVVFAIIGGICKGKAHDIFVKAVSQLNCKEKAEFWIIGSCPNNVFVRKIQEIVKDIPSIKMFGVMTREELYNVFPQIDVVVCASREETMSITITEGMMFGKACITTEKTGIAEYMRDGENGFVIPAEDEVILRDRMEWLITHRKEMQRMGKAARETYERHFTMQAFGDRLERALDETQNEWKFR